MALDYRATTLKRGTTLIHFLLAVRRQELNKAKDIVMKPFFWQTTYGGRPDEKLDQPDDVGRASPNTGGYGGLIWKPAIEEADGDAAFICKGLGRHSHVPGMTRWHDRVFQGESLQGPLSGERSPSFDTNPEKSSRSWT